MNFKKFVEKRIAKFNELLASVEVSHNSFAVSVDHAVQVIVDSMGESHLKSTFFFVGNGGSAAIASHSVVDFVKGCGLKAYTFLDHSLLTCMANDYGYLNVFVEPVKRLMNERDTLFAISSSGQSQNIIRAVKEARKKKCCTVTFSGFKKDNPLRSLGDVNFYVPSNDYRYVEDIHNFILHQFIVGGFIEMRS